MAVVANWLSGAAWARHSTPEMAWQVPVPHSPLTALALAANGAQIKALCESPAGLRKAQVGLALATSGTSDGQLPEAHFGLGKSPETP